MGPTDLNNVEDFFWLCISDSIYLSNQSIDRSIDLPIYPIIYHLLIYLSITHLGLTSQEFL